MIFIISLVAVSVKFDITSAECTDIYGRSITPNTHFIPGPDNCQLCVCDNTSPKWCKRVLCSPPQNCKSFVMGSSCCDYSCLDNTLPSGELRDDIDRKFLITIATAFVILSVLLFIIHKLRFRTVQGRLQNRQVNEDRRSIGSIGFITGSIGYLNLPNGHHFDDHPLVHFPIYKPNANYFPRGEAPPPYEEAVADTTLNVTYTSQLLRNESLQEISQQRRLSNSVSVNQLSAQQRIFDENCVCELRQVESGATSDVASVYNCMTQHRTIPSPICLNTDQVNSSDTSLPVSAARICPIHKKNNICKQEFNKYHRESANSSAQQRAYMPNSKQPNTCPPKFHVEMSDASSTCTQPQHRTLPLSGSLSSPLPSTSDSSDGQNQFSGSALAFSSAVNICSSNSNDQPEKPASITLTMNNKNSSDQKFSNLTTDSGELQSSCVNDKKFNSKLTQSRERVFVEYINKEQTEEPSETCQLVEDYYAECENCNLNVNATCDEPDDYFVKQETMTLQRKLHEASAAKNIDHTMKVSLTLPTNSRTRSCSSKNRKCEPWNVKESPCKTIFEYISSAEEEEEKEEESKKGTKEQVKEQKQEKEKTKASMEMYWKN